MDFCDICLNLTQWITNPRLSYWAQWTSFKKTPYGVTRATCQLCDVIFNNLRDPLLKDIPLHLVAIKFTSVVYDTKDLYCQLSLIFRCEDDPSLTSRGGMRFALWADEGNPASAAFIPRPPILIERVKDVAELTTYWLNNCSVNHGDCSALEEMPLPTRVLEISGSLETPSVKLVETNGAKGHYCALSHCWGQEEQPLKTTRDNLQNHLTGIPLEQLPRTFRDTVRLAQGIGIKFVWVDSLCIIQLDPDWSSEAPKMGEVYGNATLVIAAAGSKDWKEGLFVTERQQPVKLSRSFVLDGATEGSFYIAPLPLGDERPMYGPLNGRGWALQEWYLARRLLFFMPGGITWKCNEVQLSEQGNYTDLGLYEKKSWLEVLRSYSRKKLTYHTDRLHALRGIVADMQRTRQDQYIFEYGVWEDQILEQILWRRVLRNSETRSLELPSWCWAANEDVKLWAFGNYRQKPARWFHKECKLASSGSLSVVAPTFKLTKTLRHISRMYYNGLTDDGCLEEFMLPGYAGGGDCPSYLIWNDTSDEKVLGIAVFDGDPVPQATCFVAASIERESDQSSVSSSSTKSSQRSGCRRADVESNRSSHGDEPEDSGSGTRQRSIESRKSSNDMKIDRDGDHAHGNATSKMVGTSDLPDSKLDADSESSCLDTDNNEEGRQMLETDNLNSIYDSDMSEDNDADNWITSKLIHLQDTTNHIYLVLLLEPIGEATFKRVGLAIFYPHAFDVSEMELSEFQIM